MRPCPQTCHSRTLRRWPHAVAISGIALAGLLFSASGAHANDPPARPNIVLIVAEDLSPRIGAFGDPLASTPNIDALAEAGVRYTNVFTTAGVCAPSRAALITGRHAISIGAQHMRAGSRPAGSYVVVPPPEVKAFPELLRRVGYHTSVDFKLDYQFSGALYGSGPFTIWDVEGTDAGWREREPGQPFFAMFALNETHESGVFEPLGSWPSSATHLIMQVVRAAQLGRPPMQLAPSPDALSLPPYYPDTPTVRKDLARHYANIVAMDRRVGEIVAALEEDGLSEETIVVWTTDHGDGLPRAKRELFDSGIHVPMIVRTKCSTCWGIWRCSARRCAVRFAWSAAGTASTTGS